MKLLLENWRKYLNEGKWGIYFSDMPDQLITQHDTEEEAEARAARLQQRNGPEGVDILPAGVKYIVKQAGVKKDYQIYCDMDGVLVDFVGDASGDPATGVLGKLDEIIKEVQKDEEKYKEIAPKLHKAVHKAIIELGDGDVEIEHIAIGSPYKKIVNLMYRLVSDDEEFWANLEWMPGGKELWEHIKPHNPIILTSPMSGDGSKSGKIIWCERELGLDKDRIILETEKYKYATPNALLIDDFTKNTVPFEERGGKAILHTDAQKTIGELEVI